MAKGLPTTPAMSASDSPDAIVAAIDATQKALVNAFQRVNAGKPGVTNVFNPFTAIPAANAIGSNLQLSTNLNDVTSMARTLRAYVTGQASKDDHNARLKQIVFDYTTSAEGFIRDCQRVQKDNQDAQLGTFLADATNELGKLAAAVANYVGKELPAAFVKELNFGGAAVVVLLIWLFTRKS